MNATMLRSTALQAARLMLVALLLFADARAQSSVAAEAGVVESRIKAAFICKFGNYVEWPRDGVRHDGPFVIGVVADDPVVGELVQAARGHTVNGRPIIVRKLVRGDPVDGLDIVFVGHSGSAWLAETLAAAHGQPILTITESGNAADAGSIVNFVVVDDKVRFDIALEPAEHSNLKISGRLLAVARKVTGRPS
ncbi:MAG: YfiR family protein [Caldimonas sp.]